MSIKTMEYQAINKYRKSALNIYDEFNSVSLTSEPEHFIGREVRWDVEYEIEKKLDDIRVALNSAIQTLVTNMWYGGDSV